MADSKKNIKQKAFPRGRSIARDENPERYYLENPSWNFGNSDMEMWAFTEEHIGKRIWEEILPRLKNLETQTWNEILVINKKQNHAIEVGTLNKDAQNRLAEKYIEAESLISLRLTGNHRIYGYMIGSVYNVLWYDDLHGDNKNCVCRSYKKHT